MSQSITSEAIPEGGEAALPLAEAAAGVRRAQREIFLRFHRAVLGYCLLASGRDQDKAEDLVQETFVRAFRALPTLRNPQRFSPWLFTIAANVCKSRGSADSARARALALFALEHGLDRPPIEDARERELRIAVVRQVLEQIPDSGTRAVVLRHYGDPPQTTREIARELNMPHGTVTVRLMRFRHAARGPLLLALKEAGLKP